MPFHFKHCYDYPSPRHYFLAHNVVLYIVVIFCMMTATLVCQHSKCPSHYLLDAAYISAADTSSCTHAVTVRNFAVRARYQRTVVPTPDGGIIGLDWFRCQEACQHLPESAPILLVLHSITGRGSLHHCAKSELTVCNGVPRTELPFASRPLGDRASIKCCCQLSRLTLQASKECAHACKCCMQATAIWGL